MTPLELAQKIDWEGGIVDALQYYGLDEMALDDSDPELKSRWDELVREYRKFEPLVDAVYELLPQPWDAKLEDQL